MEHFGPETYGDRVADVYDEWYKPVDTAAEVAVKEASLDRVRLDASVFDAHAQRLDATQVRITPDGIRLVHAKLRFAWPPELELIGPARGAHARASLVDV